MAASADHQPSDSQIPPPPTAVVAVSPEPPPPDHHPAAAAANPPKRQRRPSVRLGEIGGDPPYENPHRRPGKTWRFHKDPSLAAKTSKTRPLTNLVNGGSGAIGEDSVEIAENFADSGHRKGKIKKPAKRARTNWNKFELHGVNNGSGVGIIESTNFENELIENDEFREFEGEGEGSESPLLKENHESPIGSGENMGLQFWDQQRRRSRCRVSDSTGVNHNEVNSPEKNHEASLGVREWLLGLGLGRYAPVFEIHEVDDEVLPMLTMEDLKDMGINAVGSRRKMYSAILKLRKGFS